MLVVLRDGPDHRGIQVFPLDIALLDIFLERFKMKFFLKLFKLSSKQKKIKSRSRDIVKRIKKRRAKYRRYGARNTRGLRS